MHKTLLYITLVLLVLAIGAHAQMADKAELQSLNKDYLGYKPSSNAFGLLDLSKLQWTNSYAFSYFSGGNTSGSVGIYTASIMYEFSPSLLMHLDLGLAHNPGVLFDRSVNADASLLTNFRLDYKPSENFLISVGVNTYPGAGYYYRPVYWPYGP
jgi:hypothetical protein